MLTLSQIDVRNIRARISATAAPILERCEACLLLLDLYPSRRNRQFVNAFIRKNKPKTKSGAVTDLYKQLFRERIVEHRKRIKQKQTAPSVPAVTPPVGAVGTAPANDGHFYFVDAAGNVLGRAPEPPIEEAVFDFTFRGSNGNQS